MPYDLKYFSDMRINSSQPFKDIWMSWSNIGFNLSTNFLGLPSDCFIWIQIYIAFRYFSILHSYSDHDLKNFYIFNYVVKNIETWQVTNSRRCFQFLQSLKSFFTLRINPKIQLLRILFKVITSTHVQKYRM